MIYVECIPKISTHIERLAIQEAAERAREQFERHEVDARLLQTLYATYNPSVGDVARFVQQANELFPRLNCGLATVYLKYILGIGREEQGNFGDEDHTFLLIEDDGVKEKTVVDITSDQYSGPRVYVGPLQAPWSLKQK